MSETPDVITRYFDASARDDVSQLIDCFTEDAWVIDDGERHDGKGAIKAWRENASSSYNYTTEVRDVVNTDSDEFSADTHVEGDFPGGVADLKQVFTLRDGSISSLQISVA